MKVKLLDVNCMPKKAHVTDAGFDIKARDHYSVFPQDTIFVSTGVCVGLLFSRSSMAKTPLRMANSVGVIDSGYKGEIKVPLYNTSEVEIVDVDKYNRIAQLVIMPITGVNELEVVDDLGSSERGNGGFGSTGK